MKILYSVRFVFVYYLTSENVNQFAYVKVSKF